MSICNFAPHELDFDLLCSCRQALNKLKANNPRRKDLKKNIEEYEVACRLNCGPILARSRHWDSIAIKAHRQLTKLETEIYCNGTE